MNLMNKDLRDLPTGSMPKFKQDPKLVAAIDKLFYCNIAHNGDVDNGGSIVLPERKLKFEEVQNILRQDAKVNTHIQPTLNERKKSIIKKIQDLISHINSTAETGDNPQLTIRNQRLWSNCFYDLDRVALKSFNDCKKTTVCYSSKEDKNRFSIIVFVLTKVQELLLKNLTVTRRELFYQNISRLRNQGNLDMAVRDVCCLLESPPWSLGILATAKGLIAGPLTMHYANGNIIDCTASGGVLVPQDIEGIKEFRTTAKYILVIEKDAIFQKLFDEGVLIRLGPVIMITAQSHLASSLACSSLALLGATFQDITTLAPSEAKLRMTELDKRKLASLLKRPYLNTAVGSKLKEELKSMLATGIKAEIEAMAPTATALCDAYLPSKIIQGHYLG
ncbi:hypothetical protein ACJJTC_012204 [Scirpophaga incertulas]